jgi:chloramphenicol-sensitive protein RarD
MAAMMRRSSRRAQEWPQRQWDMHAGVLCAFLAYTLWGLFPLYFKHLAAVPAFEIVLHRSLWSVVVMVLVLAVLRRWAWLAQVVRKPRELAVFALSALLLSANWLVYVWAVNHDRVIDASLGYFITPLVNVALGYSVLHERPRRAQWVALGMAAAGVAWLTVVAGQLPWIGLVLGGVFGVYGLLRKTAALGALEGLALETLLLAPFAAALLAWGAWQGTSAVASADAPLIGWLLLSGPLTALPLLLFAAGARRLSMTTLGVLQYTSPTIQLGLGVWLYHEPFGGARLAGFVLIWIALALYSAEGWWWFARRPAPAPT